VTELNTWALPETEHDEHGPCGDDDCGIRDVLDRLGDRWSVLVIVELTKGVRRFGALKAAIPGISQRMLTVTTKRLIRDGMVERTVYPTIPPQTDYRLRASPGPSPAWPTGRAGTRRRSRWRGCGSIWSTPASSEPYPAGLSGAPAGRQTGRLDLHPRRAMGL
jgi:DNA-binding HxlR family transcriptional regulator